MQSPFKNRYKEANDKPRKSLLQLIQQESSALSSGLSLLGITRQNLISCNDFQQFLTEFSIQSSDLEVAEFMSRYGKNNQIPVSTLKRILTPPISKSKSVTYSPAKRQTLTIDKSILDKSTDTSLQTPSQHLHLFFQALECKLPSYDLIIEYFYLNRNNFITFEEFCESCAQLFSNEFDYTGIFAELAEKNLVYKEKFRNLIENFGKSNLAEVQGLIRIALKKKFKNFTQAFDFFKKSNKISTAEMTSRLGFKGSFGLTEELSKYEFKKFWFNKENICRIDFCIEKVQEFEICDSHFKGFILRGEETLRKISVIVEPERCVEAINNLLASLNKGLPLTYPGIHKRDVKALQTYLKYKQGRRGFSLSNTPC